MSLTRDFARFLRARAAGPLDAAARCAATALFVDGVAVAVLGSGQSGPRIAAALARETRAAAVASLIGMDMRGSVADAARVNGMSMHALDYEPMWNPANHALSTTLPAVLALAEREAGHGEAFSGLGARLLIALSVGIEAQARLRLSSGQFEPADLVFHPPGVVGPIGSAMACGILLDLDEEQLAHAIGIAASRAAGVLANVGSMTKALHCGAAAAAGLEAALLAQAGFTADADALAGPRGFGAAFFGERFDPARLTGPAGDWHIVAPGPAFKLYPSQYGTHFVICAALDARARLPAGARIVGVRITCPPMPYVDRAAPISGLAGKFSFQYTAAAALLDGTVDVGTFTDARRFAADMRALLPRIEIAADPAREGRFERMAVDLTVTCADGTVIAARCDGPPGIWGRPAAPERLRRKALDCFASVAGPERAAGLMAAAEGIGDAGAWEIRDLMASLAVLSPAVEDHREVAS